MAQGGEGVDGDGTGRAVMAGMPERSKVTATGAPNPATVTSPSNGGRKARSAKNMEPATVLSTTNTASAAARKHFRTALIVIWAM
jgi:hypothetical protein